MVLLKSSYSILLEVYVLLIVNSVLNCKIAIMLRMLLLINYQIIIASLLNMVYDNS